MSEILVLLDALSGWFLALPRALMLFIYGLLLTYTIAAGGYALARSGVKPLWVLLLLVPTINLCALWLWAYRPWPRLTVTPPAAPQPAKD